MILRSRRKPPTTAQNTWATTNEDPSQSHKGGLPRAEDLRIGRGVGIGFRNRGPALGLGIVLATTMLMVVSLNRAHAEDGAVQAAAFTEVHTDSAVQQASYTVSESGHRYQWQSYKPKPLKKKAEPLRAEAAQFTTPAEPPLSGSVSDSPMQDPFGGLQPPSREPAFPNTQQILSDDTEKKLPSSGLMNPGQANQDQLGRDPNAPPPLGLEESTEPPSTEEFLTENMRKPSQECPSPDDILYSIGQLNHLTAIRDTSIADPNNRPRTCDLVGGEFVPRQWQPTTFMWQASGLCHKPAYFEDVHLERYGHSWGPYVQPLMSGAHFFLNVPILPYKMGLYPPNECIYTLGYYRPGSCAPYMLDPLPLSVRAALAEGGAAVGMAYLLP